jgi:hypothetical protein
MSGIPFSLVSLFLIPPKWFQCFPERFSLEIIGVIRQGSSAGHPEKGTGLPWLTERSIDYENRSVADCNLGEIFVNLQRYTERD